MSIKHQNMEGKRRGEQFLSQQWLVQLSMDATKCSKDFRWDCKTGKDVQTVSIRFLAEAKTTKKPKSSEVSPPIGRHQTNHGRPLHPLVFLANSISTTMQNVRKSRLATVIHFVLEGRAGKISLPFDVFFLVSKTRDHLNLSHKLTLTSTRRKKFNARLTM